MTEGREYKGDPGALRAFKLDEFSPQSSPSADQEDLTGRRLMLSLINTVLKAQQHSSDPSFTGAEKQYMWENKGLRAAQEILMGDLTVHLGARATFAVLREQLDPSVIAKALELVERAKDNLLTSPPSTE